MGAESSPKITKSMAQAWVDSGAFSEANIMALWERLSPVEISAGVEWYPFVNDWCNGIAIRYNQPVDTVYALTAVLSANTHWTTNMRLVVSYLDANVTGDAPVLRSLFAEKKALRLLGGESPESVVGGPKVTDFWLDIVTSGTHPTALCLDRHMPRSGFEDTHTWQDYFTPNHALVPASYYYLRPFFQRCADRVGLAYGQFQSVTWERIVKEYGFLAA